LSTEWWKVNTDYFKTKHSPRSSKIDNFSKDIWRISSVLISPKKQWPQSVGKWLNIQLSQAQFACKAFHSLHRKTSIHVSQSVIKISIFLLSLRVANNRVEIDYLIQIQKKTACNFFFSLFNFHDFSCGRNFSCSTRRKSDFNSLFAIRVFVTLSSFY
jgi:hypothetical protein